METGVMGLNAQMIADDEIVGSNLRAWKGFGAEMDALAVEMLAAAMSSTHNFLAKCIQ